MNVYDREKVDGIDHRREGQFKREIIRSLCGDLNIVV